MKNPIKFPGSSGTLRCSQLAAILLMGILNRRSSKEVGSSLEQRNCQSTGRWRVKFTPPRTQPRLHGLAPPRFSARSLTHFPPRHTCFLGKKRQDGLGRELRSQPGLGIRKDHSVSIAENSACLFSPCIILARDIRGYKVT